MFVITLVIAVLSLTVGMPRLADIDWQTIGSLFMLMIIVQLFQYLHVFTLIAKKLSETITNTRTLIQLFIALSFISSMFLTNDIAILTLIPLLAIILQHVKISPIYPIVLLVVAANLGSCLLPIGNPQNLFIYTHYHLNFINFIMLMLPIGLLSILLLWFCSLKVKKIPLKSNNLTLDSINVKRLSLTSIATIFALLGILHIIPIYLALLIALIFAVFIDYHIFNNVDYALLLTFICFFIIVSNIKQLPWLTTLLKSLNSNKLGVYLSSIGISQLISNVPAAVLWAPFTYKTKALLFGVNIGGLGTLIASLANLLAYKQYRIYFQPNNLKYLKIFSFVNLILLVILGVFGLLLI